MRRVITSVIIITILHFCCEEVGLGTVFSQTVSPELAAQRARSFFTTIASSGRKYSSAPLTLSHTASTAGRTHFYVFNRQGGGWVIIGGDEVARQVIAFSDKGTFSYDDLPENACWWLQQYETQIDSTLAASVPSVSSEGNTIAFSPRGADVAPLTSASWDQFSPFCDLTPTIKGKQCPIGCAALTMAQIMYYYRWPASGVGQHSYYDTRSSRTYSSNFAAHEYDWTKFHNDIATCSQPANASVIAQTLFDIAVSLDMMFSSSASSSYLNAASSSFPEYFQYDPTTIQYITRTSYTTDAWESLIYNELQAGRPVFYTGKGSAGGHAFLCDGYDSSTNTFSIKWGWAGDGPDGFYGLSALNPSDQSFIDAGFSFNETQSATIGIQPLKPAHNCTVTLHDSGTTITASQLGGHLTIPDHDASGSDFLGWTTQSITTPTSYQPSLISTGWYTPTSDQTLYPLFSYSTSNVSTITTVLTENFNCNVCDAGYIITTYGNTINENFPKTTTPWSYMNGNVLLGNGSAVTITSKELDVPVGSVVRVQFDIQGYQTYAGPLTVTLSGCTPVDVSYTSLYYYGTSETKTVTFISTEANPTIAFSAPAFSGNQWIAIDNISVTAGGDATFYATDQTSFTAPLTITDAKWGTFHAPYDVEVEEGVYAYAVTTDGTNIQRQLVAVGSDPSNNIIPAHTPVLVYKNTATTYTKSYTSTYDTQSQPAVADNLLVGTLIRSAHLKPTSDNGFTNYVLQKPDSRAGWYSVVDNGTKTNSLAPFRAYLSTDLTSSAVKSLFDSATSVHEVTAVPYADQVETSSFNLSGQQVGTSYHGVVIVNGKKFLKK